jgi:Carboxypeptidase regulatory-like domain/TonB-dependent Receptor Plug Domain
MMLTRWFLRYLAALAVTGASLLAQTTASLTGVATIGGEPLAGVTVTITSPSLQGARTAITGPGGSYNIAALPPGDYRIRFEAPGMRERTEHARLQLAQTTRADAAMMAEASESLTVEGVTPPELETTAVAATLTLAEVERLPVLRNQFATAQLMPGVTANTLTNGQLQISGAPGYDSLALVNGVVVNENTRGQMRPMYVEDAIDSTTVLTGAVSAEYGRFTGGVVSTITRSGGNELSASIRDSLSNPAWSAVTPANETREDSLNHVWEATLGGYVLRDRLWYFAAGRWAKNDTARQTVAVPAFSGANAEATPRSPQLSYLETNDQKRYEGKLTAQLGARHSLVGSYFGVDTAGTNFRAANNIYDDASLTTRNDPDALAALRYDLLAGRDLLVTARASRREMSLQSGSEFTDLVRGTVLFDRANQNARFNAPALCSVCGEEERDNQNFALEAQWFTDTRRFGSHSIVAGADRFDERRTTLGHDTGSDFGLFVTRAQWKDGAIYPVITPTTNNGGGTFIRWTPLFAAPEPNRLRTDSVYVNDRWDATRRWSVSAGLRYDRNDAVDADGSVMSDDSRLSPRLAVHFDPAGDGRQRFSASYGEYASRVADSIASGNQTAGATGSIDFAYRGPAINDRALTVAMADAIRMVFDYFNSTQGGTNNRAANNLRPNGTRVVPGYTSYVDGTLASPYVRELTAGYGLQLGSNGFAKIDLVSRDWRDLYAASVTPATRRLTTPLGIPVDLILNTNSNDVERTYRAVQLQARWSGSRIATGAFYTWSQLRGNHEGENANGAVADADPSLYYSEFLNYERFSPEGWLRGDQRHRLRAWIGYDVPLPPAIGVLHVSLLQSYDSGLPYSAVAPVNATTYAGAPANPGYNAIPNGVYFISDRGEFRTEDAHYTDLAVRFSRPVLGVELFVQGDLNNAMNNDSVVDPQRINTSVQTSANSAALQPFNPFTTTPVEGTHYQLNPSFGQPLNDLAYQRPRTVRVAIGARF